MTDIVDDFASIGSRLRELEGTKPAPAPTCKHCDDAGFVVRPGERGPIFSECPNCGNPEGHPCRARD